MQNELDYDGWLQVKLYHSFENDIIPNYSERGNITISSVRSGSSNVVQPPLNAAQINKLQKLAEQGGKYRLKAVVKTSSGSEITLLSSVLAVSQTLLCSFQFKLKKLDKN